jgi:hypothetical protein
MDQLFQLWAARPRVSKRTLTGLTPSTSHQRRPRARETTGCRPFWAGAGGSLCASTVRKRRGSADQAPRSTLMFYTPMASRSTAPPVLLKVISPTTIPLGLVLAGSLIAPAIGSPLPENLRDPIILRDDERPVTPAQAGLLSQQAAPNPTPTPTLLLVAEPTRKRKQKLKMPSRRRHRIQLPT